MKTHSSQECGLRAFVRLALQVTILVQLTPQTTAACSLGLRGASAAAVNIPAADNDDLAVDDDATAGDAVDSEVTPARLASTDDSALAEVEPVAAEPARAEADAADDVAAVAQASAEVANRLIKAGGRDKKLRVAVSEQLKRDHDLDEQVKGAKSTIGGQKKQMQALSSKAQKVTDALKAEQGHNRGLKGTLAKTHDAIKKDVQKIGLLQEQLQRNKDGLNRVSQAERAAEEAEKEASQENRTKAQWLQTSMQDAARLQHRAKAAEAQQVRLRKVLAADVKTIHAERQKFGDYQEMLQAKVAQLQAQLAATQSATLLSRQSMNASLTVNSQLKAEADAAVDRRQQLGALLQKERSAARQRDELLRKELGVKEKDVATKKGFHVAVQKKLGLFSQGVRSKVANLTAALVQTRAVEKRLELKDQALKLELAGNFKQAQQLTAEVSSLKDHVQESDGARRIAEGKTEEATQELAQARAVARQLEGTVPQLLQQAALARKARDDEKDMRSKTEHAIVQMQQQYTSAVQAQLHELDSKVTELAKPTPAAHAAAAAAAEPTVPPLPANIEDLGADLQEDLSTALKPAAAGPAQDDSAASPDLAGDSQGLGALLQVPM